MNCLKTPVLSRIIRFFFRCYLFYLAGALTSIEAKIVFCVDGEIYVSNDDGSRRRRLTHSTQATHRYPRWSPDGKRIAFTRYLDKTKSQTTAEVFVMNADGTDPQRLTYNNVLDTDPSWSPDGQHIAFSSTRSESWEVFAIEVATRTVRQITGIEGETDSAAPDWSPDGTQIVFERFIDIENGIVPKTIYVMSADGQNQRPVLRDPPRNGPLTLRYFPRWAADGQRILFSEVQWLKEKDLEHLVVQRIGGRKQVITDINDRLGDNWMSTSACWMENDRAILISIKLKDKPNPNYNLYRYALETAGLRRLTREPSDEEWPDWIEGSLSVSPHEKLTTLWGEIKQPDH
ncbi:MAG: DPP IV N-terminal domain-containing protein [Candidatus Poribacteria bacterium]|nr:DPP IV N-terminal domain-containing protein [Candidatus Poribacteria bacterium]